MRCRGNGAGVVAGEEPRLQLANPVPAGGDRHARILLEVSLELLLVEAGVIERAESRGQAAQGPDQLELCGDGSHGVAEPRLAHEVEPGLGLALHLAERVATGEKVRDEVYVAVDRAVEVADLLRRIEDTPQQRAARPDMPCPGIHETSEDHVDEALETVQPALLHQVEAELAEAITPPCSRRSTVPARLPRPT